MNKTKLISIMLVLFLTSLACNAGQLNEDGPPPENPPEVVEESGPASDTVAEDPAPEEPVAEPTEEAVVPVSEAPATASLAGLAWGEPGSSNYREVAAMSFTGQTPEGETAVLTSSSTVDYRNAQPSSSLMSIALTDSEPFVVAAAVVDDQFYTYSEGQGCTVFDATGSEEVDISGDFEIDLMGEVNLVAAGIEINGVQTNQYAVDVTNLPTNATDEIEIAADSVTIEQGNLYLSAEGGHLIRLEMSGQVLQDAAELGFDLGAEVVYTFMVDYIPLGDEPVLPPAGCEAQAGSEVPYPMMPDAQNVVSSPGSHFFETPATVAEVIDFYKAEMALAGWTLTEESVITSFGELVFTKDGQTVAVEFIRNGDLTAVTIEER